MQSGVLQDNRALIENLPFISNVDEILEREDRLKQAMQQLQAMDEEIKKLRGDLQTANRAEVQAEKKVEVQKFKTDLKEMGSDIKADVKVTKARLSDEVKNKPTKAVGK
jgi:TolA-binding protein